MAMLHQLDEKRDGPKESALRCSQSCFWFVAEQDVAVAECASFSESQVSLGL
jgi:hypothetical protein